MNENVDRASVNSFTVSRSGCKFILDNWGFM